MGAASDGGLAGLVPGSRIFRPASRRASDARELFHGRPKCTGFAAASNGGHADADRLKMRRFFEGPFIQGARRRKLNVQGD